MKRIACRLAACVLSLTLALASYQQLFAEDHLLNLQTEAVHQGHAAWGHWGPDPQKYISWSTHSNRLIPIYTFGIKLDAVRGEKSVYRDAQRLEKLYGQVPDGTLNPTADYLDQTDVYHLQRQAVASGKKYIFLVIFDGLDWTSTRAAATYYSGEARYDSGRGTGLFFQDYRGVETDFGYYVCSPHNNGTKVDVDGQIVLNPGGTMPGGYDPQLGGDTPWSKNYDPNYLISKNRSQPHAYTDSSTSACSTVNGIKSYNNAVNVDFEGKQVPTLPHELQKDGFGIGLVTSVPISHATPAGMYAHNVSRNDYQDLTRDLVGLPSVSHRTNPLPGVDVLIGAGWGAHAEKAAGQGRNFIPGPLYYAQETLDKVDVRSGGKYRVVTRTAGVNGPSALAQAATLAAQNGERLLGIFGVKQGHLPYATADGDYRPYVLDPEFADKVPGSYANSSLKEPYSAADLDENPTLADMTRAALTVLEQKEKFWMLVEPGDVDWASHGNNVDNMIGAVKSGDDAVRAVVEWIEARDAWEDSAVIVTADHGHLLIINDFEAFIPPIAQPNADAVGEAEAVSSR